MVHRFIPHANRAVLVRRVDLAAALVRANYQDGLREFADIRQSPARGAMLQFSSFVKVGFHFSFSIFQSSVKRPPVAVITAVVMNAFNIASRFCGVSKPNP